VGCGILRLTEAIEKSVCWSGADEATDSQGGRSVRCAARPSVEQSVTAQSRRGPSQEVARPFEPTSALALAAFTGTLMLGARYPNPRTVR
jgi:hypothetical protein